MHRSATIIERPYLLATLVLFSLALPAPFLAPSAAAQPACVIEGGNWKIGDIPIKRTVTAALGSTCNHGVYISAQTSATTGIELIHLTAASVAQCGELKVKQHDTGWFYEVTMPPPCHDTFEIKVTTRDKNFPARFMVTTFRYALTVTP